MGVRVFLSIGVHSYSAIGVTSMYYVQEITTPFLTTKANAQTTIMGLAVGWIKRVKFCFPPGPRGLTHVQVYRYEHQLYPTTPGGSFHWDNFIFEFHDNYPLLAVPYEVKVVTWNLDDTFEHTIEVHIEVAEYSIEAMLHDLIEQGLGGAFG